MIPPPLTLSVNKQKLFCLESKQENLYREVQLKSSPKSSCCATLPTISTLIAKQMSNGYIDFYIKTDNGTLWPDTLCSFKYSLNSEVQESSPAGHRLILIILFDPLYEHVRLSWMEIDKLGLWYKLLIFVSFLFPLISCSLSYTLRHCCAMWAKYCFPHILWKVSMKLDLSVSNLILATQWRNFGSGFADRIPLIERRERVEGRMEKHPQSSKIASWSLI